MPIQAKFIVTKVRLLQALWLLLAVFQALILAGLIDYKYIAGGRLTSWEQAQQHLVLAISVLIGFTLLLEKFYRSIVEKDWSKKWLRGVVLVISIYFILNTVGNLLAVTLFEKVAFTPITAVSAIFCIQFASKSNKYETSTEL